MLVLGQISKREDLEQNFEINFRVKSNNFVPNYNLRPGSQATVITTDSQNNFSSFTYGLTPFWASNKVTLYEAPVDGDVPVYPPKKELNKRILQMPAFRKPIRQQRCIIPVDYFITIESSQAYLFALNNKRPFAIAGVYDHWKLTIKDEILSTGFCPITLPQVCFPSLPISRLPLIVHSRNYRTWLAKETPLSTIADLLDFYPENEINCYPVDFNFINKGINDIRIVKPIGTPVQIKSNEDRNILDYFKNMRNRYR